ncbi:GNAT family N-acetyltransferase [Paenibacillus paeoniae]|uniref:N-acetyltransferase n=1 Tax=Paenibacillus paeoniae TaxID=2292705 RepID=A0A371P6P9_9BACL|nr:GNAT family N-acetyltransferase [Paenibacillus paeoniae]REK71198.1 N-acetyltransferase [Paenibacillus paeoniae]
MSQFTIIATDRLIIRTLEMKDKEAFFEYRAMPEVYKYQSWRPESIGEVESFITANMAIEPNTRDSWLQLAVCLKEGQLVGDMGIHFMGDDESIEIGYTLSPEFQGQGYAFEAVKALIDYLFLGLKKHRITGSVDPDHIKYINLLERLGFRKEAHFIKSFRLHDQWVDDCVYAILAEEWK